MIRTLLFVPMIAMGFWSHLINWMMPEDSRPVKIEFSHEIVTETEFDAIAKDLRFNSDEKLNHIDRFKKAGILSYEGPKTCLQCHEKIMVQDAENGKMKKINLMKNLTGSTHYKFFTMEHENVWGFNGELADNFPMGKIDRPCPKPGSFAMTAWAELVVTEHGDTLSEGCGQCHIGGQVQVPLGEMMPGYKTLKREKDAIDCLICHSVGYDMNKKQVSTTKDGGHYWNQDRSMRAAMSVVKPTSETCLRCHQHNFGGDIYIDESGPEFSQSMGNLGNERPRIQHPGSKRGTPYTPTWDVHAAAGLDCIECHTTEGHLIAKGTHTTTMMTNDLPNTEVSCEKCHTDTPHETNEELADYLNDHIEMIACQTCHIPNLHPDNATMRDFDKPMFEEHPGIFVYTDTEKETEPGSGIKYAWWNGDATFLGNPIGDNPNEKNLYKFYDPTHIWPEFENYDYDAYYERVLRPIAKKKPSKLYAMKLFNGKQHIDLQNIGPFGGMFVPYNLPTYYTTGNPELAASKEMEKGMMKMMYGWMFDIYLMNKFMRFMDDGSGDFIKGWNTKPYEDVVNMTDGKVEPRWIPNDALLEISHAIRLEGALTCGNCHSPDGVLDWKSLGYDGDEIESLIENPME